VLTRSSGLAEKPRDASYILESILHIVQHIKSRTDCKNETKQHWLPTLTAKRLKDKLQTRGTKLQHYVKYSYLQQAARSWPNVTLHMHVI